MKKQLKAHLREMSGESPKRTLSRRRWGRGRMRRGRLSVGCPSSFLVLRVKALELGQHRALAEDSWWGRPPHGKFVLQGLE